MENALLVEYAVSGKNKKAADVYSFLETYIVKRERLIAEIEQVIERYEKRRMLEEQAQRTMSPLRKMLSGKKPDHHLAVEYIHYVKKPRERVNHLRNEIEVAKQMLRLSAEGEIVTLPMDMIAE